MVGFEIKINDNAPISVASDSCLLFVTVIEANVFLLTSGTDSFENRLSWPDQILKVGDKVNIKVKDLKQIDKPSLIREKDIEYVKERYFRLKAELENKGLV